MHMNEENKVELPGRCRLKSISSGKTALGERRAWGIKEGFGQKGVDEESIRF